MEDERILDLYWRRDQQAIEATERSYGARCRRLSRSIVASWEDAEECVADAYLSLWNSIPPKRPAHLAAYLSSVVRNISVSRVRANCSQKRGGGEFDAALEELGECLAGPVSVERDYELRELAAAVNSFLHTLSPDDRRIFMCRYWLVAPTAEVAARLGCSHSKVKTSLYRTRQKLNHYLIKEGLL